MLEKMPRKAIATVLAVGLGGLGLTGCGGSTEDGSWKVGVYCPDKAQVARVNGLNQNPELNGLSNTGDASFSVTCIEGVNESAPTGFELLSGTGTTLHEQPSPSDVITINYTWETGDGVFESGDNPAIQLNSATEKAPAAVVMNGISTVQGVSVGQER
jgi:hypothetical protein